MSRGALLHAGGGLGQVVACWHSARLLGSLVVPVALAVCPCHPFFSAKWAGNELQPCGHSHTQMLWLLLSLAQGFTSRGSHS
jgi:hypothetical protein